MNVVEKNGEFLRNSTMEQKMARKVSLRDSLENLFPRP
jgi:hypothetical protein